MADLTLHVVFFEYLKFELIHLKTAFISCIRNILQFETEIDNKQEDASRVKKSIYSQMRCDNVSSDYNSRRVLGLLKNLMLRRNTKLPLIPLKKVYV